MPSAVRWAIGWAIAMGVVSLIQAFATPLSLAFVPIYYFAVRGLRRNDPWGGFGPALLFALLVPTYIPSWRSHTWPALSSCIFDGVLAVIFLRAGWALRANASSRSRQALWIAATMILAIVPFGILAFNMSIVLVGDLMLNTAVEGDHILVVPFGAADPTRGDVITFFDLEYHIPRIDRIVGIPGDRLRVVNRRLVRNGSVVDEPYVVHQLAKETTGYWDNFPGEPSQRETAGGLEMLREHVVDGEVVVPKGSYFVLGDNRHYNLDSRAFGFVPRENVIGKARLVYWSSPEDEVVGLFRVSLRDNGFTWTRWRRIFTVIR